MKTHNIDYDSTFVIHLSDTKTYKGHLEYWYDIFKESAIKFTLLAREESIFKNLMVAYPDDSIVYAKTIDDLEQTFTLLCKTKVVFYTMNSVTKNLDMLNIKSIEKLKHIYIGSKHSDILSTINKSYRAYDEIWVSGQAQVDKFKEAIDDTRHLEFKITGKPQLEHLFVLDKEGRNAYLYLSDNEDFLLSVNKFISKIDNQQHFIYSKNNKLPELVRVVRNRNKNLIELKNFEDIYWISDKIKYIISDINYIDRILLAFDVPLFVYVSKNTSIDLLELDIPKECLYFFTKSEDFKDLFGEVENSDVQKEDRMLFTEYFLGKKNTLNKIFYKELTKNV